MVLSRNDKIIAVIAVILLVVAAVAVFTYTSEKKEEIPIEPVEKTFPVTWDNDTLDVPVQSSCNVGKKAPYKGTVSVEVPDGSVLISVDFQISWKDDKTYIIRKNKGLDTLTVKISHEGGKSESYPSTGGGNKELSFNINDIPTLDSVLANDSFVAEEKLNEMFADKNTASFDISASIKIGERIIRPFLYFRDKGNSFNLKVSCEYYTPLLEEPLEEDELPPEEGTSYLGLIISTGNFGQF